MAVQQVNPNPPKDPKKADPVTYGGKAGGASFAGKKSP